MQAGDNDDEYIMPIVGVNVIVKNGKDIENTSATWHNEIPVIVFDGGKDGNAMTGVADGVFHAKGTESASKSVSGLGAKGGGGRK